MTDWKVFLDLEQEKQLWHIANEDYTGSICSKEAEIQGLPTNYDPMGTRPMCSECFKIAARREMGTLIVCGDETDDELINQDVEAYKAFRLERHTKKLT